MKNACKILWGYFSKSYYLQDREGDGLEVKWVVGK